MKRILIFSHGMEIGGAERALLGLLEAIDCSQYKVDLFLMRHCGELMTEIPKNINLLPEISQYASLAVPVSEVLERKHILVLAGRIVGKTLAKMQVKRMGINGDQGIGLEYSHKFTKFAMPNIQPNVEYDLAISFLTPHYFVKEKVLAKKKIAWIHTDYRNVQVDVPSELKMWSAYDQVVSISKDAADSFLSVFPSLAPKIITIEHMLPARSIIAMSMISEVRKEIPKGKSQVLLSIGRFCYAKNFDHVPMICKMIRSKGLDVKWYLIGYGGDEQLIRQKILEAGMEDYVTILGKKDNPYPYIAACDLYVQPSRYEGKCVSVLEAQILHKPVVITNYATSSSQLEDGVDGIIVPMDNEGCANGIAAVLRDPELQAYLIENTKQRDYSNAKEIEKLYQLI